MHKSLLTLVVGLLLTLGGYTMQAQTNLQTHYNVGRYIYQAERLNDPAMYLTVEHYSLDKWGDNYFFIDLSMNKTFLADTYLMMVRNLRFWKAPISFHFEYKGGLNAAYRINHVYVGGMHWGYSNDQANLGISMSYRHDFKHASPHNMQLAGTWSWTSWNRVFTLNGFFELWTANLGQEKSSVRFISEPQFWINLNQFVGVHDDFNLSLGTEVKLSYNLLQPNKFYAMPTVAMKWTFK